MNRACSFSGSSRVVSNRLFRTFTLCCALLSVLWGMSQGSALGCGSGSATITNLPTADGTVFQVNGLNSAGQLTGYFTAPGSVPHAFLYDTNGLTDLGTLGGPAGEGIVVNSSGVVAGDSYRADFEFHAFLSSSNGLIDLGTLGGMFSTPLALNESGQVAGVSYLAVN